MLKVLINFNHHFWWVATLLLWLAVSAASLWPADQLPEVPGSDKTHHFIAYFLLMLPAAIRQPPRWPVIAVFFVLWSGVIELIQPYVNRYGEWLDLAANSAGVLIALLLGLLLNYFSRTS